MSAAARAGLPGWAAAPWCVAVGLCAGCATAWDVTEEDGARILHTTLRTDGGGAATVAFDVAEGDARMLTTLWLPEVPDALAYIDRLDGPERGEIVFDASDWWASDQNYTNGAYASSVASLNWPVEPTDAPLEPGRWRLRLRTDRARAALDVTVVLAPAAAAVGRVSVDVVLLGDVATEEALRGPVEDAVDHWRDVLYAPFGLDVDAQVRDGEGSGAIGAPAVAEGDRWLALSGERPTRAVTLVVAEEVDAGFEVLGISGGIPGALAATPSSGVAVSAVALAGRDRAFDDEERRLLAETMAHEVGHYLGLFHPIELPDRGETISFWDHLPDTSDCATLARCEAELGGNLMYPTPVCATWEGSSCVAFVPQGALTGDQIGLARGYAGVGE